MDLDDRLNGGFKRGSIISDRRSPLALSKSLKKMTVMVGFLKTHTHDTDFEDLNETDISTFLGPSSPPGT